MLATGLKSNGRQKQIATLLVSYYNTDDVQNGSLESLSQAPALNGIRPRLELTSQQRFREQLEKMVRTCKVLEKDIKAYMAGTRC